MTKKPKKHLLDEILKHSISKTWDEAQHEWHISDYWIAKPVRKCVCGKTGIKYCYEIKNDFTNYKLKPIGSTCIQRFKSKHLNKEMKIMSLMVVLRNTFLEYKDFDYIKSYLNNANFTEYLYEQNIFYSNNEYDFYKNAIQTKKTLSPQQDKWLKSIIFDKIKPFIIDITDKLTPSKL